MNSLIDVIIPVCGRSEFEKCISSLQKIKFLINSIIICSDSISSLRESLDRNTFTIPTQFVEIGISQFNKSIFVNAGIKKSLADYILCSDADIIWNENTIKNMLKVASRGEEGIAYILQVYETEPKSHSLTYKRYTYAMHNSEERKVVNIINDINNSNYRPGYGLILAARKNILKIGGYKIFHQWGWEDIDLLIRANIFGLKTTPIGSVIHLSHPRESYDILKKKRNFNIIQSSKEIKEGKILGPLANPYKDLKTFPVDVQLPDELKNLMFT
jgi:glycosyltransferase involved in cell wall biosynthesis